jgi:hypothetical protein
MSTINRLSSVDALQPGDLIPVWDGSNGDTRKASLTTLLAFIESNFADPDYSTRIVAPNVDGFNVDIGNTGDSSWLIVNPTLNYTTGSITLPSTAYAVNDQEITVVFTAQVSSFSITGAGATVLGAPTQIGTYDSFRVRYNAAQQTWYTLDTTGDGSGAGTSSIVRQDFTGDGVVTTFALANAPAALGNELQVFIDGVYQERAGYSVSGNDLVFSEAPPVLSTIEVLAWGVNDIGATTANLVTYTSAGTGAVATTVQDKLRESVSVKDFGAVGDGIVNDTIAFNLAIATGNKVIVPAGTYLVADIIPVADMYIVGEGANKTLLRVATTGSGAFTAAGSARIRIEDMSITAASGVLNARAYKQTNKSEYTAYASFKNINTYLDLEIAYDGFFIFTKWENCLDGQFGNVLGGQTHHFIDCNPAAYGQVNQANINQVIGCQLFRSSNPNGAIDVSYGALWTIRYTDFEGFSAKAIRFRGVFGVSISDCWFESVASSDIIYCDDSPSPNPQGTRPVRVSDCHVFCVPSNLVFLSLNGATEGAITNIGLAQSPVGMRISNVPELQELHGIQVLSGSATSIISTNRTAFDYSSNQNLLPIGPTNLGAINFTNVGFNLINNVTSGIGLPVNSLELTLGPSTNVAYYTIPAKLVTFLSAKTVTLTMWGHASSGAGSDNLNVNVWVDVIPTYANPTVGASSLIAVDTNTNLQVSTVAFVVPFGATSIHVGFRAGGGASTQTVIVESMKLEMGIIKALTPGLS